jgi:hypothetical protein
MQDCRLCFDITEESLFGEFSFELRHLPCRP